MKPFKTYREAANWLRSVHAGPTTILIDVGSSSPKPQLSTEDRRIGRYFLPFLMLPLRDVLEAL